MKFDARSEGVARGKPIPNISWTKFIHNSIIPTYAISFEPGDFNLMTFARVPTFFLFSFSENFNEFSNFKFSLSRVVKVYILLSMVDVSINRWNVKQRCVFLFLRLSDVQQSDWFRIFTIWSTSPVHKTIELGAASEEGSGSFHAGGIKIY